MHKPRSIKQNTYLDVVPDFRNLGVVLRILLVSNGYALLKAFFDANAWHGIMDGLMNSAALLTPILFISLLTLWVAQPYLKKISYWKASFLISLLVVLITQAVFFSSQFLYDPLNDRERYFEALQHVFLSALACQLLLLYFRLRTQNLTHALHEARLQVLRARIRPHFLFNTINAVLSIVRKQPKQAEEALEDMADLFRMAMAEAHDLVPLRQEIQLSKQYLALEQLRLGERLKVRWQVEGAPLDALIPPLLLQPLLENSVYHGIETLSVGGEITIMVRRLGSAIQLTIENPCRSHDVDKHVGNKLALRNIRERLELLFDVEASYQVDAKPEYYKIAISLPYRHEGEL
jgi:two-component system, LytTR family, sensor histidine kinase AlgZ